MAYFTERNGMRSALHKTSDISVDVYGLLLECCEKYYNNIAWKYPEECQDGCGCCGIDYEKFYRDIKYEIPNLYRDKYGKVSCPKIKHNVFYDDYQCDDYDQYALLDFIEFIAVNCRDVDIGQFHSYFHHHHLICKRTNEVFSDFQGEINSIFEKTGVLYVLTADYQVERVADNSLLTPNMEVILSSVKEAGTQALLTEAMSLHKSPRPNDIRAATEKIWDAFERLKTYYTTMDKKASASKIITDMASGSPDYTSLFEKEFKELTAIGNAYRIRHHETDKIDITDTRYYDYFFNRCLSLIVTAIQYLQ